MRFFELLLDYVLAYIIYPFIMWLRVKRKYIVPVDTTPDNVVRQNTLINIVGISADWICAIIIFIGIEHHIITYVSIMTIAMYIFSEHFKIYSEQYKEMRNRSLICKVRQRKYKYFKWYTPNLGNVIVTGVLFVVLLCMSIFEKTEYYISNSSSGYIYLTYIILGYLMFIKSKYYFLDTFDIRETVFVKDNGC